MNTSTMSNHIIFIQDFFTYNILHVTNYFIGETLFYIQWILHTIHGIHLPRTMFYIWPDRVRSDQTQSPMQCRVPPSRSSESSAAAVSEGKISMSYRSTHHKFKFNILIQRAIKQGKIEN